MTIRYKCESIHADLYQILSDRIAEHGENISSILNSEDVTHLNIKIEVVAGKFKGSIGLFRNWYYLETEGQFIPIPKKDFIKILPSDSCKPLKHVIHKMIIKDHFRSALNNGDMVLFSNPATSNIVMLGVIDQHDYIRSRTCITGTNGENYFIKFNNGSMVKITDDFYKKAKSIIVEGRLST